MSTRWSASRMIFTISRAILSLHAATARGFMMSIGSPEIREKKRRKCITVIEAEWKAK